MSKFIRGKDKSVDKEKRIIIIDHEKCKPKTPTFDYLVAKSKMCGYNCIWLENNKITISEEACMICFNIAKRAPGPGLSVVKLPTNLTTNITHSYGQNAFKLHGLPSPQPGNVLGLLGTNGIGKSTAIDILSGNISPNFGKFGKDIPTKKDIINYYRGSELQNYFNKLYKKMRVSMKPQSVLDYAIKYKNKKIKELLPNQKKLDKVCSMLELNHLFDRNVEHLSGGELQRLAIAITVLTEADVYLFDECSSFLDVKQRLIATDVIRTLIDPFETDNANSKYVIVVEHDLAVLDYMSDNIQSLYGKPGVYGVVTNKSAVSNGINQFMKGFIESENIRFRPYELTFKNNLSDDKKREGKAETISYPEMEKKYPDTKFKINIEAGTFKNGEITCLMGQNGCGKTTFMNLLAENIKENKLLSGFSISYKTQHTDLELLKFTGSVQDLLEKKINKAISDNNFRMFVLNPLKMDSISDLKVNTLSGGQMQRLSITLALGTPASVYLIDEPSAGLDCEQRVIVSKVIKKWIIEHLDKTCFLIEHDFLMTSNVANKVIVYEGTPGVECIAKSPIDVGEGFNSFLKQLKVSFRRDPTNFRPRINKKNSTKDKEQKEANNYFLFDT